MLLPWVGLELLYTHCLGPEQGRVSKTSKGPGEGTDKKPKEECNKDVLVVLIDMHSCSLGYRIKVNLGIFINLLVFWLNAWIIYKSRKAVSSEPKTKKSIKDKKVKDPTTASCNCIFRLHVKLPPFLQVHNAEKFRKAYKEEHPDNKNVSVISKEAGEKWKSMSDEEKKLYLDRVAELKAEYEKAMETYNAGKEKDQEGSEKEE
uniref:HMG box domain-containing protein n=1 Tax=Nelumbo nucifera TaxID=4432 RepID=A0A822YJR5_NELNU|nr:TPA_asm: hypothetical protein HUJ06_011681 [Nelumbo nucifera]